MSSAAVEQLYLEILLRPPSAAESSYWVEQLAQGLSLSQVQQIFLDSDEGRLVNNVLLPLTAFYQGAFARAPDAAGLSYWAEKLTSGEVDLKGVLQAFGSSSEFRSLHPDIGDDVSPEELISLLYQNLLGRSADAAGTAFWSDLLQSGQIDYAQLARSFLVSDEFQEAAGEALLSFINDYRTDRDLDHDHGSLLEPDPPEIPRNPSDGGGGDGGGNGGHGGGDDGGHGHGDGNGGEEPTEGPPKVTDDTADAHEAGLASGTDATGNVLANDGDATFVTAINGDSNLVGQTIVGEFGTLTLQSDGQFRYIVDQDNLTVNDLEYGESLADTFTYSAQNDDYYEASASLTITILGSNERIERLSPTYDSTLGTGGGDSYDAAISDGGRYVGFTSQDSNVVQGDDNSQPDPFVWDREGNVQAFAKDGSFVGGSVAAISGNGLVVAFHTGNSLVGADEDNTYDPNAVTDVYLFNRQTETVELLLDDSTALDVSLSADARFVAFDSLKGWGFEDLDDAYDIFVLDRHDLSDPNDDTMEFISISANGSQAYRAASRDPVISGDGSFVAFESSDGILAYENNEETDIFVFDRATHTLDLVSVSSDEAASNGTSRNATLSDDGRYVTFESVATNLAGIDSAAFYDIFLRNQIDGTTQRISVGLGGQDANGHSSGAVISADGRFIVFESDASNLVEGDTNSERDLFLFTVATGKVQRIVEGDSNYGTDYFAADISADGRYIAFHSENQLTPGDHDTAQDVHVIDGSEWWWTP